MIAAQGSRQTSFYARACECFPEGKPAARLFSAKYIRGHKSAPRNKAGSRGAASAAGFSVNFIAAWIASSVIRARGTSAATTENFFHSPRKALSDLITGNNGTNGAQTEPVRGSRLDHGRRTHLFSEGFMSFRCEGRRCVTSLRRGRRARKRERITGSRH